VVDHRFGDVPLEWVFKSPSDTVIPHILPFAGMADRHPRAGCRQRRAIGVPSFLLLFDQGFRSRSSLLFMVTVLAVSVPRA
jgi:hypothetical protein